MTVREAVALFRSHQRSSLKARTVLSYDYLLRRFEGQFSKRFFSLIASLSLQGLTHSTRIYTKKFRQETKAGSYWCPWHRGDSVKAIVLPFLFEAP